MAETSKGRYEHEKTEQKILDYWGKNKIYEKSVEKNKNGPKYRYLDGPPYTSGAIHLGHAWGKALRDASLRYRRMRGLDCWDIPGFDTHGLPIEVAVEQKLGIREKHEITERLGLKKFIEECQKFAIEQMEPMIKDFKRIGVWLDWENPYITFRNEYIEGAWWALKRAQENGFLYLGEKAMTWCPRCATALAKHELEYYPVTENSIFVKLKVKGKENEYLIIWTTTPWTIPFNLAVMANPELDYVRAKVDDEVWILAKGMAPSVISAVAGKKYEILEEFNGKELEGTEYEPLFRNKLPLYDEIKKKSPNAFKVILSKEHVSLGSGSGLVHCAPGCGPEDYEVGRKYKIPPFNELDEHGKVKDSMGVFSGLTAKKDDRKFIEIIKETGMLIDTAPVEHDYAHCWRCKTGVIYKTTDQWFLAVEKLKEEMIKENNKVDWVPEWGGLRWFDSWLRDLQDWCISRQRFWGIPLPIWKCEKCGEIRLIENNEEIKKLTGKKLDNLHRPWIDEVTFECEKCKSKMKRVPDVLDVWLDSGAATWAAWKNRKDWAKIKSDFILEGKDQIRGWFNSLICLSMVARTTNAYKAVYMHGFVNDSLGRKMSKSLKNIISPYEVIDKYGADTMRYYMIGAAKPGVDMNYNFEDMKIKFRNLSVLWNIHKFLIDFSETNEITDTVLNSRNFGIEEKYIISRLNSTIAKVTELYENYRLNEVPDEIERLFLDLSRAYIQMVREKSVSGTEKEKQAIFATIYSVLLESLKMFSTIAPFVSEDIYLSLREKFKMKKPSVCLYSWPEADRKKIDEGLEQNMDIMREVLQAIYSARETAQLGIRWPVKDVTVVTEDESVKKAVESLMETIKNLANVNDIIIKESMGLKKQVRADYKRLGPVFGEKTPSIIAQLSFNSSEAILGGIEREGKFSMKIDGETVEILPEYLIIENQVPSHLAEAQFRGGYVYLNKDRNKELEAEGFARELTRRVQALRKKAGMVKTDSIELFIKTDREMSEMLKKWEKRVKEKTGAVSIEISQDTSDKYDFESKEKIKGREFVLMINKV